MSAPVFVSSAAADAVVGDTIAVTGAEARHAVTVQRRAVGEHVDVVDGAGARASGVVVSAQADRLEVRVAHVGRDHDPEVILVQALAKGGRDEQAVEAAVELGITAVVPWAASRSIVQWRGPKIAKGTAKWESLALAASKQSRRALVPQVRALVSTADLAREVSTAVQAGARVLVLHESAAESLATLAWPDPAQPVWLVVGPEGGISDEECAVLAGAGAEVVLLGPHVLRASSAGPAGIAALAVARGTWADAGAARGLR